MATITQTLNALILAAILSFGISFAYAWTEPTSAPTGGSTSAPLNTSSANQSKDGTLTLSRIDGLQALETYGKTLLSTVTGNVGIGTTDPQTRLHILNGTDYMSGLSIGNAGMTEGLKIWSNATSKASYIDSIYNSDNGDIFFRTKLAGTPIDAMVIKGNGNVGIGTTGPLGSKLNVITNGATASQAIIGATGTGLASLVLDASNGDGAGSDYFYMQQNNDLTVDIMTDANAGTLSLGSKGNLDTLVIDGGKVGIGTSPSTGTMLDILNNGDIYEKPGSTCDAEDVIIAYKTTSNTCSSRTSCFPSSCTTGSHDWSATDNIERCTYYYTKSFFTCKSTGCLATQSVKCQKPKTALKINNGFSDIFKIGNKDASFGGKVGIGISNPAIDLAIGDTDTGFKWNSDGNISLRTNNQNRIVVDKDGNTQIGRLMIRSGGNFDDLTVDGNSLLNNVNFNGNSVFGGDVRINNPYAVNEYGTDGTGIKGYLKLNVSGNDYVVPLYKPLMAWVNKVAINYVQSDPDGNWATEQTKSWTADRTIDGISVYGSSDDGGYCYAYWSTGHVERYRHNIVQGDYGYYNVDNKYYNPSCDDYGCGEGCPSGPSFDNSGNVKICQEGSGSGNFAYGTGSKTGLNLAAGTVINVKARHVIGKSSDLVNCYMDVKYK